MACQGQAQEVFQLSSKAQARQGGKAELIRNSKHTLIDQIPCLVHRPAPTPSVAKLGRPPAVDRGQAARGSTATGAEVRREGRPEHG